MDVSDPAVVDIAPQILLFQNAPNPFNPRTTIRYRVGAPGRVILGVFDVRGRLVVRLVDALRHVGEHTVVWDGKNDAGKRVGSGVYWGQMKTGAFVSNKKIAVLK